MALTFAETLTDAQRKRARLYAYFSAYTGCISEVMLDSSAIIIIYFTMLQCSDMLVMFTTSFSGIGSMILLIPFASLVGRIGMKKAVSIACMIGCGGFLLMALAPFFGPYRQAAALTGCIAYCAQRSLYGVTWYPLLDGFLRKEDRGSFFGTMRYTYMIISGVLFYLIGKLMGTEPPMYLMQTIIAITGILILGRWYCIMHFPDNTMERTAQNNIPQALRISISNGPLVSFSAYICLLSIAYTSIVPLTLVYLKSYVQLPPGTVQIFSTVGIAGSITGFFFYGKLLKKFKIKALEVAVHIIFMFSALALFALNKDIPGFVWIIGAVYFAASYAASTCMCNNSTELMALAPPGNKPMAMAFQQTYQSIGVSIGRTGTALVLGANLLAPSWQFMNMTVSHYQTLFLIYGIIAAVLLILFPTLPAVVPKRQDYYEPMR